MPQIKISLDKTNAEFVSNYQAFGYPSKSAIVADAISRLNKIIKDEALISSAKLYQEVYENDVELQELTNDAANSCLDTVCFE
ncbi:MAG: hypothetical protein RLZZ381_1114 [Cyanobacteriota bacterium]|jgi:hypothetical protein